MSSVPFTISVPVVELDCVFRLPKSAFLDYADLTNDLFAADRPLGSVRLLIGTYRISRQQALVEKVHDPVHSLRSCLEGRLLRLWHDAQRQTPSHHLQRWLAEAAAREAEVAVRPLSLSEEVTREASRWPLSRPSPKCPGLSPRVAECEVREACLEVMSLPI